MDHLYVFGAGHVALPTVKIAELLGFAVTVVDERDELNTVERFGGAVRITSDPRRYARKIAEALPPQSWVLIVTHDHQLDQDLLEVFLGKPLVWLGLIGSKAKITKFFLRLRAAGVDPALFDRVAAPVGLDIGAVTPEEIAVSISAELVRVRHQTDRTPLPMSSLVRGKIGDRQGG